MTIITSTEIDQYRQQLEGSTNNAINMADVVLGLNAIAKHNGNLELAFADLLPDDTKQFQNLDIPGLDISKETKKLDIEIDIAAIAQKCREAVCSEPTTDLLGLLNIVAGFLPPPVSLAVPVTIYILKIGLRNYCRKDNLGDNVANSN